MLSKLNLIGRTAVYHPYMITCSMRAIFPPFVMSHKNESINDLHIMSDYIFVSLGPSIEIFSIIDLNLAL